MVQGARILTLDTGVGWRAATGARGRLETRWMPMNVQDRAGPTMLGSHGGDTATAALLDGYARRDRAHNLKEAEGSAGTVRSNQRSSNTL